MDIIYLSILAMVLVSSVSLYIGRECNDDMFWWFGWAFMFFAISRSVNTHFVISPFAIFDLRLFAVLLLYGVGSVALVAGAINGRRRYKETPFVMFAAIVVSAVVSAFDYESSTYPFAFAVFVGGFTAAFFLSNRTGEPCSLWYWLLGLSLFARGCIALFAATMTRYEIDLVSADVMVADLLSLFVILAFTIRLSMCRLKSRSCEE